MNQHGNAQLARLAPYRIQTRIVRRHTLAAFVDDVHPERLEDLQALRAVLYIALQLRRGARAITGIVDAVEADVRESYKALGITSFQVSDARDQRITRTAAQIHNRLHVQRVHLTNDLRDLRGGHRVRAKQMTV